LRTGSEFNLDIEAENIITFLVDQDKS